MERKSNNKKPLSKLAKKCPVCGELKSSVMLRPDDYAQVIGGTQDIPGSEDAVFVACDTCAQEGSDSI